MITSTYSRISEVLMMINMTNITVPSYDQVDLMMLKTVDLFAEVEQGLWYSALVRLAELSTYLHVICAFLITKISQCCHTDCILFVDCLWHFIRCPLFLFRWYRIIPVWQRCGCQHMIYKGWQCSACTSTTRVWLTRSLVICWIFWPIRLSWTQLYTSSLMRYTVYVAITAHRFSKLLLSIVARVSAFSRGSPVVGFAIYPAALTTYQLVRGFHKQR